MLACLVWLTDAFISMNCGQIVCFSGNGLISSRNFFWPSNSRDEVLVKPRFLGSPWVIKNYGGNLEKLLG